ncbi:MAG: hypothetical protein LBD43_00280, partial [Holosporales bacterium]|nr:hypothetical protein [Holosporales bacterium]
QAAATTACPNGGFTFGLGLNAIWPGYVIKKRPEVALGDDSTTTSMLGDKTRVRGVIPGMTFTFGYSSRLGDIYWAVIAQWGFSLKSTRKRVKVDNANVSPCCISLKQNPTIGARAEISCMLTPRFAAGCTCGFDVQRTSAKVGAHAAENDGTLITLNDRYKKRTGLACVCGVKLTWFVNNTLQVAAVCETTLNRPKVAKTMGDENKVFANVTAQPLSARIDVRMTL